MHQFAPTRRAIVRLGALALAAAAPMFSPAIAQERQSYSAVGEATAPVADAYFAAYTGRDWDALEPLLADEASFQDATATHVFGGVLSEGKPAMMERFRVGYEGITHMRFETERRLVSGNFAIYEGALDWGLDLGDGKSVDSVTPMVIVIEVQDGKVVRHRDYVDYAPFIAAVRAARGAG